MGAHASTACPPRRLEQPSRQAADHRRHPDPRPGRPAARRPGTQATLALAQPPSAAELDLIRIFRIFLRRFDIEHTFRFLKQTLGWTRPRLRTPEQADRWTWLVICAHTQLRLARGLAADLRRPWEAPLEPERLTPARVRRGFPRIRRTAGNPASAPKPTRPGPGRPKGSRNRHQAPATPSGNRRKWTAVSQASPPHRGYRSSRGPTEDRYLDRRFLQHPPPPQRLPRHVTHRVRAIHGRSRIAEPSTLRGD
jgi:hypothetical protein